MQLPKFFTDLQELSLLQNSWVKILNPLIGNPSNNASILTGVTLNYGLNTFNHNLGTTIQGWRIIDQDAPANIYRPPNAPFNSTTLTLVSDAPQVTVNIEVF